MDKSTSPYNPLDKVNLGRSIVRALLDQTIESLSNTSLPLGSGTYAIYYTGLFPAYESVAARNWNGKFGQPIYVGKAISKIDKKSGITVDASKETSLKDCLRQHAASITQANNLDLNDFYYRCLIVDDIWIPLGENMLIETFRPIWNIVIDGFGNKDPGNRRATQHRSSWDVLHAGRYFAEKLATGGITPEDLTRKLEKFFAGQPVSLVLESIDEDDD
jgi:hypothetical protein